MLPITYIVTVFLAANIECIIEPPNMRRFYVGKNRFNWKEVWFMGCQEIRRSKQNWAFMLALYLRLRHGAGCCWADVKEWHKRFLWMHEGGGDKDCQNYAWASWQWLCWHKEQGIQSMGGNETKNRKHRAKDMALLRSMGNKGLQALERLVPEFLGGYGQMSKGVYLGQN